MLKVYDITTFYNYSQKHCVVAENMAEAEKLFLEAYPDITILRIELHTEYVIVKKK